MGGERKFCCSSVIVVVAVVFVTVWDLCVCRQSPAIVLLLSVSVLVLSHCCNRRGHNNPAVMNFRKGSIFTATVTSGFPAVH